MGVVRNIVAVIVGYLIFAVSAVMLFKFAGIDPHAESGIATKAGVIALGAVFAFIGGFTAKIIAASRSLVPNIILAILMAGFAAFSALRSGGEHYTQIAAIFVFAPASLIGGIFRKKSS